MNLVLFAYNILEIYNYLRITLRIKNINMKVFHLMMHIDPCISEDYRMQKFVTDQIKMVTRMNSMFVISTLRVILEQ